MIAEVDDTHEKRYAVSPKRFKKQMKYLKRTGYTPISLDALHKYLVNKTDKLPQKPILITFDDGYMDNYENALPILKEYNFPATVFVVSDLIGGSNQWDMIKGHPERSLMGWREIEEMQRYGIAIGSHTLNHPSLSLLNQRDARKEIEESKKVLEDKLGVQINHFAYPYGDRNSVVMEMVKQVGYKTACSTRSGFNTGDTGLFDLRRIEVYGTDALWQFALKLKHGVNTMDAVLPGKYYLSRFKERILRWI
jgi:peptidoglycan/xylan/chitin deacetylase (PgdA/CDA1 family)